MTTPKYQDLTTILVHAAWADASSWNKVTVPLRDLGLRVRAAQIPLTSLSDDVAALKRLLGQEEGPVLLVAHSYAGAVITAAGPTIPRSRPLSISRRSFRMKAKPWAPSFSTRAAVRHTAAIGS